MSLKIISWQKNRNTFYWLDFFVSGIFVGCYIIQATLRSDLRCFFDIDCIQELANSLFLSHINASDIVLKNLATSHYQLISSLLEIVTNLMVEEWNNQTSYNNYFNECKPLVCTATYINRGNIIYIVTTLIGLIGGLTKVCRSSVPIFVEIIMDYVIPFLRKRCGTRNNNVHTVQNMWWIVNCFALVVSQYCLAYSKLKRNIYVVPLFCD